MVCVWCNEPDHSITTCFQHAQYIVEHGLPAALLERMERQKAARVKRNKVYAQRKAQKKTSDDSNKASGSKASESKASGEVSGEVTGEVSSKPLDEASGSKVAVEDVNLDFRLEIMKANKRMRTEIDDLRSQVANLKNQTSLLVSYFNCNAAKTKTKLVISRARIWS